MLNQLEMAAQEASELPSGSAASAPLPAIITSCISGAFTGSSSLMAQDKSQAAAAGQLHKVLQRQLLESPGGGARGKQQVLWPEDFEAGAAPDLQQSGEALEEGGTWAGAHAASAGSTPTQPGRSISAVQQGGLGSNLASGGRQGSPRPGGVVLTPEQISLLVGGCAARGCNCQYAVLRS
jgi:hypothetical protein